MGFIKSPWTSQPPVGTRVKAQLNADIVWLPYSPSLEPQAGGNFGRSYDGIGWGTSFSNSHLISKKPISGNKSFTVIFNVIFYDYDGNTFGTGTALSGNVLYCQRINDSDVSPTLCVSNQSFAQGSPFKLWFGSDSAGLSRGYINTTPILLNTPYWIAASVSEQGESFTVISVNGISQSQLSASVAGSWNPNWSGAEAWVGTANRWNNGGSNIPANLVGSGMGVQCFIRCRKYMGPAELARITENGWSELFEPNTIPGPGYAVYIWPISDISSNGWIPNSGNSVYATLDEASRIDSDYSTSPLLSEAEPTIMTLSDSLPAGTWSVNLSARVLSGTGKIKATLMDSSNVSVGASTFQSVTGSYASYTLMVSTTATATRIKLEVTT